MTAALYNDHFGFHERPFSLSPDPEFLFWSKAHTRALSVLEYGLMTRAPLTVVSGEVGTGKTTLIQALLRRVEDSVTVGLISNARGDRGALLRWVLGAFDLQAPEGADYVSLFQQFQDFVLAEYAAARHVVLIVDEAQNLGTDALEELRLLTNINSGKDELLQIIMVGQPELRDMICQPELRQFAQRVTATYHLEPMDQDTTVKYISHRLEQAGGTGQEFTPEAISAIFNESDGIPRMVNKLCDLALVYASSEGEPRVERATIEELVRDGLILKPFRSPLVLTGQIYGLGKAAE
ncbi:ExeA family protein [Thalassococcus sp. BH17M4-6]|uniref:ExeA family protein n=1 Tax=Thalassococcus sp. BH17M4-6 TaxID=3413148 RepID=UPI003BCC6C3A